MSENENKILVALDGSGKAFKTIKYLCSFKPFRKKELVLHNIILPVTIGNVIGGGVFVGMSYWGAYLKSKPIDIKT